MINYVTKDITTVERGVVAHGVNCQGAMGSGVARAIKQKWPVIYERYMAVGADNDLLGTAHVIMIKPRELFVANCYTQQYYGPGDKKYADVSAIERALTAVFVTANSYDLPVYLPKIGAGLGGLDWETEVEPVVENLSNLYSRVDTYVCLWD